MGTYAYNDGREKLNEDEIQLNFGVFFDGTLNNQRNTELRTDFSNAGYRISDKEHKLFLEDKDLSLEEREKIEKEYEGIIRAKQILLKNKRDQHEANYSKLKNKDVSPDDTEYERFLKGIHQKKLDKMGVDNSFMNDYTNVARMWKSCEAKQYGIYIEGIGTEDSMRDTEDGFQFGSGFTGVRAKVRKGCKSLADRIKEFKGSKKLVQITLDVSGFSRGAAAARNFLYEVNGIPRDVDQVVKQKSVQRGYTTKKTNPNYGNDFQTDVVVPNYETVSFDKDDQEVNSENLVNGKMPKFGYLGYYLVENGALELDDLKDLKITIAFVGAYETVSSYEEFGDMNLLERTHKGAIHVFRGPQHYFGNDVEQLQLNNLGGYSKAVHFTAMDEHRENFDLTPFPGSIEKNFPGVHCDIGGAYETAVEIVDEIETSFHKPLWLLNKLRKKIIKQYWYKDGQIQVNKAVGYRKITGNRFLKKEYSYIPLHFMSQFGIDYLTPYITRDVVTEYPIENDRILKQAKNHLEKYVFSTGERWNFKSDLELEQLEKQKHIDEEIEKEMQDIKNGKSPDLEAKVDNLDPKYYRPKIIPILNEQQIFPQPKYSIDADGNKVELLDEVVVTGYNSQKILRLIRNEYLHWSANRDWAGMDPTNSYERVEHYK